MTTSPDQTRALTGISGLDEVLCGGLPRHRVYLVQGSPGVGKTTLGLQFLLEGARLGETGLYITLSESKEELVAVASSHGWSADDIEIFAFTPAADDIDAEAQYTMYQPSEVELSESMETLLAEVARVKPARVVFDSLSEIRLLAQEPLRYRRQILALKNHFAGVKCTVLLLDDLTAQSDQHLQSLAHGVLTLERSAPLYGGARRRMEIMKLRGVKFRDGFHDYTIERGGIHVFPRLVAADHKPPRERQVLSSGVAELDALLGGGLDHGMATLLIGPAGSGKSALATQFVVAAADAGDRAAIYTFDESVFTLRARAEALEVGLEPHVRSGAVAIHQVDPAEMSPGQFAHHLCQAVERDGARVVVIDSLTGYLNAMPEERFLLNQLHELLTYMGQQGVVTILVATQHGLLGQAMVTPIDVSYLADNVLLLRYFEARGSVRHAISVVKRRSGSHERSIREFRLGRGGIKIGPSLKDFHGVLTGVPTYTGDASPLMD